MANKSIRLRTTPGENKNITVNINQDFDFLEVLSLRITQENVYQTFCANYGAVVGRVIANRGFGIPNAKVSIFIPVTDEDQRNALINSLYPFKQPTDKNSEGIRYNLLPSQSNCNLNRIVGTFPTKEEVLDNDLVLEVFEKYYKYTTKTNAAGDFMLFGVPIGQQTLHIDVDLSDIGVASVRPYDLIAEGSPEKLFDSSTEFKPSINLDVLPQIKSTNISLDVIPFWGDTDTCTVGITRADFDTGLDLKYSSLFFGSIFTDSGRMSLGKNCNPRNDMGDQNKLRTGPGRINIIRASEINPIKWTEEFKIQPIKLETFDIEGGQLIDEDGTFSFVLPMNICHVVTNEFGELVPSPDPSIGIATKGMYRFAVKFSEGNENQKFKTGTMFFPSLGKDFGGTEGIVDTGKIEDANGTQDQRFTDDITQYNYGQVDSQSIVVSPEFDGLTEYTNSRINLDFHLFEWKQVYTIAHYIKKYKKGQNRFSFVGIKNTDVTDDNNLFPYTNAIFKFDILYFLLAAGIDVFAFLLRLLITLISLCFGFCFRVEVTIPVINKVVPIIGFCISICPFNWLGKLIGTINLPGEGCGPGGSDLVPINLKNCNSTSVGCGGRPKFITLKVGIGNAMCGKLASSACNCQNGSTSSFLPAQDPNDFVDSNSCLTALKEWECCAKLLVAENRSVIRRVFADSWIIGTAYLFQFKYKTKFKRRTGEVRKEKFCGPGADQNGADGYKNVSCCLDTKSTKCNKCLLRGPGLSNDPGFIQWVFDDPVRIPIFLGGGSVGFSLLVAQYLLTNPNPDYQTSMHNGAVEAGKVGSVDVDDVIYCNTLMSTKIVSLGRIEMCPDILTDIENAIINSSTLDPLTQNPNFYTGTYFERGWDSNLWVNSMKESSYEDPTDVLKYLALTSDCSLRGLFTTQQGCHEYELLPENYFFIKEVSKIYNDVILSDINNDGIENFSPFSEDNPIANSPKIDDDPTASNAYSGFEVTLDLANRFSPCGGRNGNCYSLHNWDGGLAWPDMGSTVPGDYSEISANSSAFDTITDANNRNNKNTRSNIPYYYFGLIPGKTSIVKLRKKYFTNKELV
jgi:hypothetical protein